MEEPSKIQPALQRQRALKNIVSALLVNDFPKMLSFENRYHGYNEQHHVEGTKFQKKPSNAYIFTTVQPANLLRKSLNLATFDLATSV